MRRVRRSKATQEDGTTSRRRPRWALGTNYRAALLTAGAVALVASAAFAASVVTSKPARQTGTKKELALSGRGLEAQGASAATTTTAPAAATSTTTTTLPPVPELLSVSPKPGATGVAPTAPITLTLSAAPLASAPMPQLSPPVAGNWSVSGDTLTFTPAQDWAPWSKVRVVIPVTLASAGPVTAATPEQLSFTVQGVPLLRVQQLLAELHYLPLRFGPSAMQSALAGEPTSPGEISTSPEPGKFTWRYPNIPATLAAQWVPGQQTVVTQGAIMMFENVEGLSVDGIAGPDVWAALTQAVASRRLDPNPYDYLTVSESTPESLTVWRDGRDIFNSLVNTGVQGANTPIGTWPVFEHLQSTTMTGTDVNGYHYVVPHVPWVAYFYEGDAVHGYWRSSYGWPQSNGCVELPVANAQVVWPMDPIGTLVNVSA